jgi:putative toxin-antitoxin system antitoxin component (TIGR02293 family)
MNKHLKVVRATKSSARKAQATPDADALTGRSIANPACVHVLVHDGGTRGVAPAKLVDVVRAGLPVAELKALQAVLDVPMERLGPMLGISTATLHRRKSDDRLGPAESDRVVRYARLMGMAVAVMESEENARRWLSSPQVGLGGAVPLEFAETEVGAREVEDLLWRIEHGVYS